MLDTVAAMAARYLPARFRVPGRQLLRYLGDTSFRPSIDPLAAPPSSLPASSCRQMRRRPRGASGARCPEQRTKASLEALDGASVTEVARRYGVCRRTVRELLREYANEGFSALVDKPPSPRLARIRCQRSSKTASSRCVAPTLGGAAHGPLPAGG